MVNMVSVINFHCRKVYRQVHSQSQLSKSVCHPLLKCVDWRVRVGRGVPLCPTFIPITLPTSTPNHPAVVEPLGEWLASQWPTNVTNLSQAPFSREAKFVLDPPAPNHTPHTLPPGVAPLAAALLLLELAGDGGPKCCRDAGEGGRSYGLPLHI